MRKRVTPFGSALARYAEQALERWAFQMARRRAISGMDKAISHGDHLFDVSIQFLGFGEKLIPVDLRATIGGKHGGDFVERESGAAPNVMRASLSRTLESKCLRKPFRPVD